MRNFTLLIFILGLFELASCNKGASTSSGSWILKGNTYTSATCFDAAPGILEADNALIANTTTYATLRCYFGGSNPTTGGSFRVVNYNNVVLPHQISFHASIDGISGMSYTSTGGSGNEMVNVTVAANGYVTVSGSGIEMINGSDSSALTVNINQVQ